MIIALLILLLQLYDVSETIIVNISHFKYGHYSALFLFISL